MVVRVVRPPPCYPRAGTRVATGQNFDEHPPHDAAEGEDKGGGASVTGRVRLPGGQPRKASQKRSRPAAPIAEVAAPTLKPGDRVRWSRYTGTVRRVAGDKADVVEDSRRTLWRLPVAELTRVVG
jgi:hypothetical protein